MTGSVQLRTLGDVMREHAIARGDKIAFRFDENSTTYATLDRRINQVANGLLELGIRSGERIAFLGKNCDSYYEMLLGASRVGVVMTPINWRLATPEIVVILQDARIRLLFAGADFFDQADQLRSALPALETIIPVRPPPGTSSIDYARWRDRSSDAEVAYKATPDETAVQIYTSGTTGRPKGVMLTHRSLLVLRLMPPELTPAWNRWSDDDVSLIVNPIYHISGTGFGIYTLCAGATGLILREFDADRILDFVENDRLSKIFLVPTSIQMLLRHPRTATVDFSRVRCMLYGGSPIPLDLLREAIAVFGCSFAQMYGMTETSGTVTTLAPEDHDLARPELMRSVGKPMAGVEIAILDQESNRLGPHMTGEIAICSPSNMMGYWNMHGETAGTIRAGNWLRSGDLGYMDQDGYLFIRDRIKDMIISGGENIYPAEVEGAIYGHADIADVAVIGVPSEKWGEEVKAIVVPKPGAVPDAADIITWARSRIAGYKVPKSIDFVDTLPRNASGKILRRELRDRYRTAK